MTRFLPRSAYSILPLIEPQKEYTSMDLENIVDMTRQKLRLTLPTLSPYFLDRRKVKHGYSYTYLYKLTPYGESIREQLLNTTSDNRTTA